MTFEPTHRITYKEDDLSLKWLVCLKDDGYGYGEDGTALWRIDSSGRWFNLDGKIPKNPQGLVRAVKLNKPKVPKIKSGQEPKFLPEGTVVKVVRQEDGTWKGECEFRGLRSEAESSGLMGVVSKLAQGWVKSHYKKIFLKQNKAKD